MKGRLFPNIRQMTTAFCISIVTVTLVVLVLRLTVMDDITPAHPDENGAPEVHTGGDEEDQEYRINTKVYFSNPDAQGDFRIENSRDNPYYLIVDVRLDSGYTSVYYSGYISPGASIPAAYLQGEPLEEGEHPCTATITARDTETREIVASETVAVTLYIGQRPG